MNLLYIVDESHQRSVFVVDHSRNIKGVCLCWVQWAIPEKIQTGGASWYTFWKTPLEFFTLPLEIPHKTTLNPWIFHKIPHYFFLVTFEIPIPPLELPQAISLISLEILSPQPHPCLYFFWNSPMKEYLSREENYRKLFEIEKKLKTKKLVKNCNLYYMNKSQKAVQVLSSGNIYWPKPESWPLPSIIC